MSYTSVVFPGSISSAFRPAFVDAVAFWNNVITAGGSGYTFPSTFNTRDFCGVSYTYPAGSRINGLDILAVVEPIDGPGSILGSAGPCAIIGNFPILGIMRFDSADSQGLLNNGSFGEVIVHEMGHVIGIGTLWTSFIRNPCPNNNAPCNTNPVYTGANGIEGYEDLGGSGLVPIANTGGPGTRNGHWREDFFVNELMTGFLNSGTRNPLSVMTVKALRDLGYRTNLGASESYNIPSQFQRPLDTDDIELLGDIASFELRDINELVEEFNMKERVRRGGRFRGEIDIESEYKGEMTALFIVMVLGFLMMAGLTVSFANKQRKALLALTQRSPTENPAFLRQ